MRKPTLIVTIKSWLSLQPENCNLEFQSQRFSFETCIDVIFFFNGCFNPSIYIYHTRVYQFSKNYIVNFKRYKNLLSVLRDNSRCNSFETYSCTSFIVHSFNHLDPQSKSNLPPFNFNKQPPFESPSPCPLSLSLSPL